MMISNPVNVGLGFIYLIVHHLMLAMRKIFWEIIVVILGRVFASRWVLGLVVEGIRRGSCCILLNFMLFL